MKNILHICNNYVGTKVHSQLCKSILLSNRKIMQDIFIPIRKFKHLKFNSLNIKNINEDYVLWNMNLFKFLPLLKVIVNFMFFINKKYKADAVIAHTVWSDGLIAYINYLIHKTPYTVSVRDTDFNVFLPKLIHYHWLIKLILKNANAVIFINKAYLERSTTKFPKIFLNLDNLVTIPNGVDEFWLKNLYSTANKKRKYDFIFVGNSEPRKNLKRVFRALEIISKNKILKFCIVGLDELAVKKIIGISNIPDWIFIAGKKSKEDLIDLYRESKILFVPSYRETFGLVYIEALSQGCAVIHAKGEGIDKMFDSKLVNSVDPYCIQDMSKVALDLLANYEIISDNVDISDYDWKVISVKYTNFFEK
ncbi:glycosyltransferase family 4 protein [Acinetobacter pseudolwoffii]|uniref:Glycosyl transferase family 1 domain-containing protein n=1 Tax=Acinetobacter pseudolwoffii TaxID=2053287 RepID=A0A2H9ULQ4_9GAMM|nr:glycosyltransferase family 4 protein [Acinetobacter pseudolwoffii]PJI32570.1 hypothetical protein CU320_07920 [Acinetobacter pseudolwoffii]